MVKRSMSFSTPVKSKRQKTFGRTPTTNTLAKRVAKLESQTEWKSKDFYAESSVQAVWTNGGRVISIFEPASGSGSDERVGRKVTVRSIQLHWGLVNDSNTTVATAELFPVRTMIVYDKQSNAGVPSYSDIVADQLGASDEPWSFRNLDNKDRFTILYDSFGGTEAGDSDSRDSLRVNYAGAGGDPGIRDREIYLGKVYRTMEFPVIFGTSNQPLSGAIYVVCCGNQDRMSGKFVSRVRYVDE